MGVARRRESGRGGGRGDGVGYSVLRNGLARLDDLGLEYGTPPPHLLLLSALTTACSLPRFYDFLETAWMQDASLSA